MNHVVIKLDYPITVDSQQIKELRMRRCKVKDRRMAMKQWHTDEDREIGLIANLCELPPEAIEELDAADYAKVQKEFGRFFGLATLT